MNDSLPFSYLLIPIAIHFFFIRKAHKISSTNMNADLVRYLAIEEFMDFNIILLIL